jgi:hypothetical protein
MVPNRDGLFRIWVTLACQSRLLPCAARSILLSVSYELEQVCDRQTHERSWKTLCTPSLQRGEVLRGRIAVHCRSGRKSLQSANMGFRCGMPLLSYPFTRAVYPVCKTDCARLSGGWTSPIEYALPYSPESGVPHQQPESKFDHCCAVSAILPRNMAPIFDKRNAGVDCHMASIWRRSCATPLRTPSARLIQQVRSSSRSATVCRTRRSHLSHQMWHHVAVQRRESWLQQAEWAASPTEAKQGDKESSGTRNFVIRLLQVPIVTRLSARW